MALLTPAVQAPHRRYHDVDVLRFLAAVGVMLMHYVVRGFYDGDHYSPVSYGAHAADFAKYNYLAVNLFFMISGFVILMSAEGGTARSFLRSRIVRLYPAYWFCCTVSFFLAYLFFNDIFKLSVARYLLNMTMFQGFFGIGNVDGVYWTLLVELKFYLLILFILLIGKMPKIEFFLAGWLLVCVMQVFLKIAFLEKYLITNFASFFIGGCLFYRIAKLGFSWQRLVMLALTVPLGIHFELVDLVRRAASMKDLAFHQEMVAAICAAFYIAFFAVILRRSSDSPRYKRIASKLGSLSYPVYLIHFTVGMVIYNLVGSKVDKWVLLVSICAAIIVFAYFINKFVEVPLAALMKRRLFRASTGSTAQVA